MDDDSTDVGGADGDANSEGGSNDGGDYGSDDGGDYEDSGAEDGGNLGSDADQGANEGDDSDSDSYGGDADGGAPEGVENRLHSPSEAWDRMGTMWGGVFDIGRSTASGVGHLAQWGYDSVTGDQEGADRHHQEYQEDNEQIGRDVQKIYDVVKD